MHRDGPSRMVKRPTESGGEPSSSNRGVSAGIKARHPSLKTFSNPWPRNNRQAVYCLWQCPSEFASTAMQGPLWTMQPYAIACNAIWPARFGPWLLSRLAPRVPHERYPARFHAVPVVQKIKWNLGSYSFLTVVARPKGPRQSLVGKGRRASLAMMNPPIKRGSARCRGCRPLSFRQPKWETCHDRSRFVPGWPGYGILGPRFFPQRGFCARFSWARL